MNVQKQELLECTDNASIEFLIMVMAYRLQGIFANRVFSLLKNEEEELCR